MSRVRPASPSLPQVYMDLEVSDPSGFTSAAESPPSAPASRPLGRLVFQLRSDLAPKTAENFRVLCAGDHPSLSYMGSIFHRIVPSFIAQGGDIDHQSGHGGRSIYGPTFADEPFLLSHTQRGVLSMANKGPGTNGSQFFITLSPCTQLDGRHVAFGTLISGDTVLDQLESFGTDPSGRPTQRVVVAQCGVLTAADMVPTDGS
eukprot:TRINITY_DN3076_c0_g1_i2.p2 TRINITY_DN3076_c0_g1~~TRINITY_DN3076_c0_g1_i2.p2  ORF type:complete len:203 (+),score=14.02 TRINITY_DN3076_c0_g1_i2:144-752(+)